MKKNMRLYRRNDVSEGENAVKYIKNLSDVKDLVFCKNVRICQRC